MKKIITYLKTHIKADFDLPLYTAIAVFLLITITLNYIYDFEDSVIDGYYGKEIRFVWYFYSTLSPIMALYSLFHFLSAMQAYSPINYSGCIVSWPSVF